MLKIRTFNARMKCEKMIEKIVQTRICLRAHLMLGYEMGKFLLIFYNFLPKFTNFWLIFRSIILSPSNKVARGRDLNF